jgi:hypothetical protein
MSDQSFEKHGRYILEDYDRLKPFSSFLPGIAGVNGIPLWAFYVNRGQGITSFGTESKDFPIMEFQPANRAYQQTSLTGFRTFIKILSGHQTKPYEPFSSTGSDDPSRRMYIGMGDVEIEEIHQKVGLKVNAHYYTVPNEDYSGLVRDVRIENISDQKLSLEILDGMPEVIPYGVNDYLLKHLGRTIEAWMEVYNFEAGIPFYKIRASIEDVAEVREVVKGNFALSFLRREGARQALKPIVDPKVIFGSNLSFTQPEDFQSCSLDVIYTRPQKKLGQYPCAFFGGSAVLDSQESVVFSSLFGNADSQEKLSQIQTRITPEYLEQKRAENEQILSEITSPIRAKTGQPVFDGYARQTYLDNILRGGLPLTLPGGAVYHVFSRKHGDPERDYNFFYLTPEYYSQGNGNYRDVNQNRRSDVLFYPEVEDFNLRFFLSLIQLDGYNPLVIKGIKFILDGASLQTVLEAVELDGLAELISEPFTPGSLIHYLRDNPGKGDLTADEIFGFVFSKAKYWIDADHGEGFWVDHWTYNLDLVESFLAIYPDRQSEMLFSARNIPWYESFAMVQPRENRYQFTERGLRQYDAVVEDEEKEADLKQRREGQNWVKSPGEDSSFYCSTVFEKLFALVVIKSATLDPAGMGVEMEAGKPGWYDALNGLPGLLGSSVSETYEIARLAAFLQSAVKDEKVSQQIKLPIELGDLLSALVTLLSGGGDDPNRFWHETSKLREVYRAKVYAGIAGRESVYSLDQIASSLQVISGYLSRAIRRIEDVSEGLLPTYFYYQEVNGGSAVDLDIESLELKQVILPPFLEGFVHAMRIADEDTGGKIYQKVRESDLFDRSLGMYKVNASLSGLGHELGRTVSFPPGWLENESIWLHMEYKYLLELIRNGLYEQFYQDIQTALVPFQDASTYGRSPMENSSFIVSSAYPDTLLHGTGFVARLSGSTAEFLTIWFEMFVGRNPFEVHEGELALQFKPRLAGWLFPKTGEIEFLFLGHTPVTYHNPQLLDTWKTKIESVELTYPDRQTVQLDGGVIPSPYAAHVREGRISAIQIRLGEN